MTRVRSRERRKKNDEGKNPRSVITHEHTIDFCLEPGGVRKKRNKSLDRTVL